MIVRESPSKAKSKPVPNWPPKSPHEALLSSPSGRKRVQERYRDTSPSPLKRSAKPESQSLHLPSDDDEDEDEDEDEETLQLKLQAIEAKLKLKKLQKAKEKASIEDGETPVPRSPMRAKSATSIRPLSSTAARMDRRTPEVQVPISPVRRRSPPPQTSPARVLLGIDKGLKAQDVSLKRSASQRTATSSVRHGLSSFANSTQTSSSRLGAVLGTPSQPPKTFNERLAESRLEEKRRNEQQQRNQKARSSGFGLKAQDIEDGRKATPPSPKKASSLLPRSKSLQNLQSAASSRPSSASSSATPGPKSSTDTDDPSSFDSYSGLHLSRRHLSHSVLTRSLTEKDIYTIPRMLKTVHSPRYEPPDVEGDYVVLGIIASKSLPRAHKETQKVHSKGESDDTPQRSRFMVIRLTDLHWELDLFLFDTGFEAFWKLTPGTVIAILNPGIMPPRNKDTGAFSLKLSSSEDTVLEIGTARDLAFCSAVKKDGQQCAQWIDGRKTSICEFHLSLQLEKTKAGRMEVNTVSGYKRGKDNKPGFMGGKGGNKNGGGTGTFRGPQHLNQLPGSGNDGGRKYDSYLQETYYVSRGTASAAKLLDADDGAFEHGMSREERFRKRLAEREKEKELGAQLAALGSGMGSEYLRLRQQQSNETGKSSRPGMSLSSSATTLSDELPRKPDPLDAESLGLLSNRAEDVSLAAVGKRKRPGTASTTASDPVGWGGAFKRGLLLDPQQQREKSPEKKKTRLVVEGKGIRRPGRESLPNMAPSIDDDDDDDDDGLEIIH